MKVLANGCADTEGTVVNSLWSVSLNTLTWDDPKVTYFWLGLASDLLGSSTVGGLLDNR